MVPSRAPFWVLTPGRKTFYRRQCVAPARLAETERRCPARDESQPSLGGAPPAFSCQRVSIMREAPTGQGFPLMPVAGKRKIRRAVEENAVERPKHNPSIPGGFEFLEQPTKGAVLSTVERTAAKHKAPEKTQELFVFCWLFGLLEAVRVGCVSSQPTEGQMCRVQGAGDCSVCCERCLLAVSAWL